MTNGNNYTAVEQQEPPDTGDHLTNENESKEAKDQNGHTVSIYNDTSFENNNGYKFPADGSTEPEEKVAEEEEEKLSGKQRAINIATVVGRIVGLIGTLYFFICSLDLLSDGFTLLGGKAAGTAFNNPLLNNPICGLMLGVVATAFLQSSSTSTSITITMVAAGLMNVSTAIPVIMGANIGTSVTGVLVAVTQAGDKENFKRAFSAATVHDMFNWLTVICLLPTEIATGYLEHLTSAIIKATHLGEGGEQPQFLSVLTDPFTDLIVQVDKTVLEKIAAGHPDAGSMSLLKYWCNFEIVPVTQDPLMTPGSINDTTISPTAILGITPCSYLFHDTSMSDEAVGGIVLLIALFMLLACLIIMVKILKSLLQGSMANVIKKTINANFPGRAACLTGYVAILVGAVVTILVQSSSVVASALTPLVGLGVVTVERVYPMMLGANIGTTSTAVLAAFAASAAKMEAAFQIALCHLFFNLTGILIWYPIPQMRRIPIALAKFLGKVTTRYRWFAFLYLFMMFFLIPLLIFALSIPGWYVLAAVGIPFILLLITIGVVNLLQKHRPQWLPEWLQTWEFLPLWMRSLEPLDKLVSKLIKTCSCCKCYQRLNSQNVSIEADQSAQYDSEQELNTINLNPSNSQNIEKNNHMNKSVNLSGSVNSLSNLRFESNV